ncbi:hypothetical protein MMC32_006698 [Xylographa parallela]|nr:hypothetical protein [Xylographa parallela]
MIFGFGERGCIGFNFALQEVKVLIPSLVYRHEFSNAGKEPVEYDTLYRLVKPVNFYIRAKRRPEWCEPIPKPVPESKLGTASDLTPQLAQSSKVESTAEPATESSTGSGGKIAVDMLAKPIGEATVGLAVQFRERSGISNPSGGHMGRGGAEFDPNSAF